MSSCDEIVCSKCLQFLLFCYRKDVINVFDDKSRVLSISGNNSWANGIKFCEILTMCLPWRLVHRNLHVYVAANNFFIVLPPLKRYFSCALTMTSLRSSFSLTYNFTNCHLFLVTCFLGNASVGQLLLFVFLSSCCFQGLHNWIVCSKWCS